MQSGEIMRSTHQEGEKSGVPRQGHTQTKSQGETNTRNTRKGGNGETQGNGETTGTLAQNMAVPPGDLPGLSGWA